MKTENRVQSDLKQAIKSGDSFTRDVLRLLSSDIKNKAINERKELSEEEVLLIVKKNIKSRRDSIEQFSKGGREDLASHERAEVELLEKYMPEQMSDQQIEEIVKRVLSEIDASESANFGVAMKKVMAETGGKADGGTVSEILKKALIG